MMVKRLTLLTLAVLAGCGRDKGPVAAADSLNRDLRLMPVDSTAPLNDRATADQAPTSAPAPAPGAKPKPRPKPVTAAQPPASPSASAPAPAAPIAPAPEAHTLAAGTTFSTTVDQEINSRVNKAGESVTATVAADVKDDGGRVVIPAGSKVTLTIAELHESENKSDKTGKLTLTPTQVEITGRSYELQGSAEALDRQLKDRKTNAGDVAKVGGGAAAGAIVGRILGGKGKGTIIGGIIGGAVGAQRAAETKDRDVVVPASSRVEITLEGPLTR